MRRQSRIVARAAHVLLSSALLFVMLLGVPLMSLPGIHPRSVYAEQLQSRSLRIASTVAGAVTRHTFTFSYGASGDPIGSVVLEYCTSPLPEIPCDTPTGLDASSAVLALQTGEVGFTILSAQPGKLILTRGPVSPTNNPSSYAFDAIVNPTGAPDPFYVRITTHTTADGSGAFTDFGSVVNSTTQGILLSTEVPPILKFCVGISLGTDCTAADESIVDLGNMSTSRASSGTSQMIAGTNAEFGLAIAVYGTSMTSGNNVIPALAAPTPSAPGNAQFGFNLRDNSDPDMGEEPSGVGVANPTALYNIPNRYVFVNGSTVATSSTATDTRKFTSSYVVNISPGQPPGIYTATLTYICTATF